jgi:hypothetical protein
MKSIGKSWLRRQTMSDRNNYSSGCGRSTSGMRLSTVVVWLVVGLFVTPGPGYANLANGSLAYQPSNSDANEDSGSADSGTTKGAGPKSILREFMQKGLNTFIAVLGSVIVMLGGLWLLLARVKEEGFGASSLQAMGLVLFLPTLLIVAILRPDFKTEALAALLGTVAGYILSHSKADVQHRPPTDKEGRS